MKAIAILIVFLVGSTAAIPAIQLQKTKPLPRPFAPVKLEFCDACIQLSSQGLNEILNIILNVGVAGGCAKICSAILDYLNITSQIVDVACTFGCTIFGAEQFIKLIQDADLDVFYFCELIRVCPIKDNGDAKITSLKVVPATIKKGDTFAVDLEFTTRNGTGTGEIEILIQTVDGIPIGENLIMLEKAPGNYGVSVKFQASSSGCDPSQQICEEWLPGMYEVDTAICNGECGSKHPHSQVYDQGSANFTLVKG